MQSANYASRLSKRLDLGPTNLQNCPDSPEKLQEGVSFLASLMRNTNKSVVLTGAGISTNSGVVDFRGPNGVWTHEALGTDPDNSGVAFEEAQPTRAHMALVALVQAGLIQHVASQNVDGLHLRSGLQRQRLSELHGNLFLERCTTCHREYFRNFDVGGVSFQKTGRRCNGHGCRGWLVDFVLDWEDELPEFELDRSESMFKEASLCLCIGTSLHIRPVGQMPLLTAKAGGKIVIINLSKTALDKKASLIIRGDVDQVMTRLLAELKIPFPILSRVESLVISVKHNQKQNNNNKNNKKNITTDNDHASSSSSSSQHSYIIEVSNPAGELCPLPFVEEIRVRTLNDDNNNNNNENDFIGVPLTKAPYKLQFESERMLNGVLVVAKLRSWCSVPSWECRVALGESAATYSQEHDFEVLRIDYNENSGSSSSTVVTSGNCVLPAVPGYTPNAPPSASKKKSNRKRKSKDEDSDDDESYELEMKAIAAAKTRSTRSRRRSNTDITTPTATITTPVDIKKESKDVCIQPPPQIQPQPSSSSSAAPATAPTTAPATAPAPAPAAPNSNVAASLFGRPLTTQLQSEQSDTGFSPMKMLVQILCMAGEHHEAQKFSAAI